MSAPTPFAAVNAALQQLQTQVQAILGEQFIGLYLYGSLSSGDFNLNASDIDFVVVTATTLPDNTVADLSEMHARLMTSGHKWTTKLEGSYIPQHTLRHYDPDAAPCPQINEGRFYVGKHGSDWIIQRHILREQGIVVAGPPIRPFIDPVTPHDLQQAVRGILQEWWLPMLQDPSWLQRRDYQAFATLTMCRVLYTLKWGKVASKPVSAHWAMTALASQWVPLITHALAWPQEPQPDSLPETVAFIRYTVTYSGVQ